MGVVSERGAILKIRLPYLGLLLVAPLAACVAPQPASFDFVEASIGDIQSAILQGNTTCREIVAGYIERIETYKRDIPYGSDEWKILYDRFFEEISTRRGYTT